ncbi:MAG: hypothetical protein SOH58_08840, partial [Olsenella sp.]
MPDVDPAEGGRGDKDRIQEIVDFVLEAIGDKAGAGFSTRTYSDEPILRTGADFRREREQREGDRARGRARSDAQALRDRLVQGDAQVRRAAVVQGDVRTQGD